MKLGSTLFLRGAVVLIGLVVLALCIFGLPRAIGTLNLGGYDPILLGMYLTVIPFYIALYQALKLLGFIDGGKAFSDLSVKSLKSIKWCAAIIGAMYTTGMPYIYYVADKDDAPGVILISLVIIFASVAIAVLTGLLQELLRKAIEIKSENDLTV